MAARAQSGIIPVAVAIAQERSKLLDRIRELLGAGNDREAISVMKKYLGMTDEKKSNRANPRIH